VHKFWLALDQMSYISQLRYKANFTNSHQKCALENCSMYKASSLNGAMWRSPCDGNTRPTTTETTNVTFQYSTVCDEEIRDRLSLNYLFTIFVLSQSYLIVW